MPAPLSLCLLLMVLAALSALPVQDAKAGPRPGDPGAAAWQIVTPARRACRGRCCRRPWPPLVETGPAGNFPLPKAAIPGERLVKLIEDGFDLSEAR